MRVTGLASGMDVDSIVKNMMQAKREPLNRMQQQKQLLEWRRDSYKEVNSKIVDFRNNKLLTSHYNFSPKRVEVTGQLGALTAKATENNNSIDMTITDIKLAKGSTVTGTASLPSNIKSNSKLKDITGTDETVKLEVKSEKYGNKEIVTIELNANDTISSALQKINQNGKASVTATFDEIDGIFKISSNAVGKNAPKVTFSGSAIDNVFMKGGKREDIASDAVVTINDKIMEFNDNKFIVNGVSIALNKEITKDIDDPIQIKTINDSTKVLESIKSFIKDYNEMIDIFDKKLAEQKYRDFPPLTAEQKKDMKENDIKLWDEKARSGLLKSDSILKSAQLTMRSSANLPVGESGLLLSSIGITTGHWSDGGKLTIESESKLLDAIEKDPNKVFSIFNTPGDDDKAGIISRLGINLMTTMEDISKKAGTSKFVSDLSVAYKEDSVMGKELKDLDQRIKESEKKMIKYENQYYRQFTAMEQAINKYNSQSAMLAGFGQQ